MTTAFGKCSESATDTIRFSIFLSLTPLRSEPAVSSKPSGALSCAGRDAQYGTSGKSRPPSSGDCSQDDARAMSSGCRRTTRNRLAASGLPCVGREPPRHGLSCEALASLLSQPSSSAPCRRRPIRRQGGAMDADHLGEGHGERIPVVRRIDPALLHVLFALQQQPVPLVVLIARAGQVDL
jgi:hypothetical protein